MAYIYKITNRINEKAYIGKTNKSVHQRFQEHQKDSQRKSLQKRPLYNAFNFYGIDNFFVETIEECDFEQASIREIYWVKHFNTYQCGYNATLGGDSKNLYDYEEISQKYLEFQNQKLTAEYFGCCIDTVLAACREFKVSITSSSKTVLSKPVKKFSLNHDYICSYLSLTDAAKDMVEKGLAKSESSTRTHISSVCQGKRKTAYKHLWQFE